MFLFIRIVSKFEYENVVDCTEAHETIIRILFEPKICSFF